MTWHFLHKSKVVAKTRHLEKPKLGHGHDGLCFHPASALWTHGKFDLGFRTRGSHSPWAQGQKPWETVSVSSRTQILMSVQTARGGGGVPAGVALVEF